MTNRGVVEFNPDYAQEHAGAYLGWTLETRGIKQIDFAKRCGRPPKTISEIIAGRNAITPETAIQFEKVLGGSADYWLALEYNYQLQQARVRENVILSDTATKWVRNFPYSQMVSKGFIQTANSVEEKIEKLLRFFGVSTPDAFEGYWSEKLSFSKFKQHNHSEIDPYAVAAWLRRGELIGNEIDSKPYSESKFKETLLSIRSLTMRPWKEVADELTDECASAGVALAFVPFLSRTGLRGSASWLNKDKALIILSDWGKYEEKVWFSFFHEACHILNHSKKAVFVDHKSGGSEIDEIEREADEFSAESLISKDQMEKFTSANYGSLDNIRSGQITEFASSIGIAPGLFLERLQHEGVVPMRSRLNTNLKRKMCFD